MRQELESVLPPGLTITSRHDNAISAEVTCDLIYQQPAAVDETHVAHLAERMSTKKVDGSMVGQLSEILLGYIPAKQRLEIVDGFHRVPAVRAIGLTAVVATIRECTPESVSDLRILASTHEAVKFPRIVSWVYDAWDQTAWANRVTVSQGIQMTFGFRSNSPRTGEKLGITPEEATGIRSWFQQKCELWRLDPTTIYRYLLDARHADPKLILAIRDNKTSPFRRHHLVAIATELPGQDNYPLQQLVCQTTNEHNLTVPQTKALAGIMAAATSHEEAAALVTSGAWKQMVPARTTYRVFNRPLDQRQNAETYNIMLFDSMIEVARLAIKLALQQQRLTIPLPPSEGQLSSQPQSHISPVETADNMLRWSEQECALLGKRVIELQPQIVPLILRQSPCLSDQTDTIIEFTIATLQKAARARAPGIPRPSAATRAKLDNIIKDQAHIIATAILKQKQPLDSSIDPESYRAILQDSESVSRGGNTRKIQAFRNYIKNNLVQFNFDQQLTIILNAFFNLTPEHISLVTQKDLSEIDQALAYLETWLYDQEKQTRPR